MNKFILVFVIFVIACTENNSDAACNLFRNHRNSQFPLETSGLSVYTGTGYASNSLTSDEKIIKLITGTGIGGVKQLLDGKDIESISLSDVLAKINDLDDSKLGKVISTLKSANVFIDDKEVFGVKGWRLAGRRVVGYVTDAKIYDKNSSVKIENESIIAGIPIRRQETIKDGSVEIKAWFTKAETNRGFDVPVNIKVTLSAEENSQKDSSTKNVTTVTASAVGVADVTAIVNSFKLKMVRRIAAKVAVEEASKEVSSGLKIALNKAEKRGRELHSAGHGIISNESNALSSKLELIVKSIKETELR